MSNGQNGPVPHAVADLRPVRYRTFDNQRAHERATAGSLPLASSRRAFRAPTLLRLQCAADHVVKQPVHLLERKVPIAVEPPLEHLEQRAGEETGTEVDRHRAGARRRRHTMHATFDSAQNDSDLNRGCRSPVSVRSCCSTRLWHADRLV
jgi:hypothetical protein